MPPAMPQLAPQVHSTFTMSGTFTATDSHPLPNVSRAAPTEDEVMEILEQFMPWIQQAFLYSSLLTFDSSHLNCTVWIASCPKLWYSFPQPFPLYCFCIPTVYFLQMTFLKQLFVNVSYCFYRTSPVSHACYFRSKMVDSPLLCEHTLCIKSPFFNAVTMFWFTLMCNTNYKDQFSLWFLTINVVSPFSIGVLLMLL